MFWGSLYNLLSEYMGWMLVGNGVRVLGGAS